MATQNATLRSIVELSDDTGQEESCGLDSQDSPFGPLVLSGYKVRSEQTVIVLPAAADQVVAMVAPCGFILLSTEKVQLRIKAGEQLLSNLRYYAFWAEDSGDIAHALTSILLTGNGSTEALVKILIVEKV